MATKFVAYRHKGATQEHIGVLTHDGQKVRPLIGYSDLFDVIQDWQVLAKTLGGAANGAGTEADTVALADVEIRAPLRGRDVLAVGKNYAEHAREFNSSGYDSSDKVDMPTFPVIFTKRASSIVAHGADIFPHPHATETLDYEGELGVIIGQGGYHISKSDAMKHVWGYTIINDVTARERQRDHKQFFIGKSFDTFCPVGPYAVPASALDCTAVSIETRVNGEVRQRSHTSQLIFDVATLVETISMGITLQPGDMIATGTPAGVGFGYNPPRFLRPGDVVEVEVEGLGVLRNKIGDGAGAPPSVEPVRVPRGLTSRASDGGLVEVRRGVRLHVEVSGKADGEAIVFVHGLGGNLNFFKPAVQGTALESTHKLVFFDWSGHGLSPVEQPITVESLAQDLGAVLDKAEVTSATIVAHSMGGLIANTFAAACPDRVRSLVLIGPVKALGDAGKQAMAGRAQSVREKGMLAVVDAIIGAGLSERTRADRALAVGYTRALLLATNAEGYAQACLALGGATDPDYGRITASTLIIAGAEDKTSPKATTEALQSAIAHCRSVQLQDVAHWHALEDAEAVSKLLDDFCAS